MNLIELDEQIEKHGVIKAFQNGVADALINGVRDDKQSHHYYKRGYDFGMTLYVEIDGEFWRIGDV